MGESIFALQGRRGMRRAIFVLVVALVTGVVCAQESPVYAPADNPFQGDFTFVPGQPVGLHVMVEGVGLDELTLSALGDVRAGEKVQCQIVLAGRNTSDKDATVTTALLLEDEANKALLRLAFDPLKVRSGKEFRNTQQGMIAGDTLLSARKIYLIFIIAF
jgi:hypothetical protein